MPLKSFDFGKANQRSGQVRRPAIICHIGSIRMLIKNFMRVLALFICWCIPFLLFSEEHDSIVSKHVDIEEVQVVGKLVNISPETMSSLVIKNTDLATIPALTTSSLLSSRTNANILSYGGIGSLSTVSIRGLGGRNSEILWNGVRLNLVSSGDFDLSLFPASFIETISVNYNSLTSPASHGANGGTIELFTSPCVSQNVQVKSFFESGSFGYYSGAINLAFQFNKSIFSIKVNHTQAENDFKYVDLLKSNYPKVQSSNNALKTQGIQLEYANYFNDKSCFKSGIWLQGKSKENPDQMGVYIPAYAKQNDSLAIFYNRYKYSSEKITAAVNGSYYFSSHQFEDKGPMANNSFAKTNIFSADASVSYSIFRNWNTYAKFSFYSQNSRSSGYTHLITERFIEPFVGVKYTNGGFVTAINVKGDCMLDDKMVFLPFLGVSKSFFTDKLLVYASITRKFRRPTFNDKYWFPSGNPKLKPEDGVGGEVGLNSKIFSSQRQAVQYDIIFFQNYINNWIQWIQSYGGVAHATSFSKVNSSGVEQRVTYTYKTDNVKLSSFLAYTYNKVVWRENGSSGQDNWRVMSYSPMHLVKANLTVKYHKFELQFSDIFSSAYYFDDAHGIQPNYNLISASIARTIGYKKSQITLIFGANNLSNEQYQIMRLYPMPPRSVNFKIIYQLN